MLCPKCGFNNSDNNFFCNNCGCKLRENISTVGTINNTEVQSQSFVVPSDNIQENININSQNVQLYNQSDIAIKKKSQGKKKVIILASIVLLILAAVVCFVFLKKETIFSDIDSEDNTAFFLKNNGKYALFNDEGEKLTDFIFTSIDYFCAGTTVVEKDGMYGIINSKGKVTVDFGKYKQITPAACVYEVEDNDDKTYLIDGSGKILYEPRFSLKRYDDYLILKANNEYTVLNKNGKKLISFSIAKELEDTLESNSKNGYVSVFYNNNNYVFNNQTLQEVVSFKTNIAYCISDSTNNESIILGPCSKYFKEVDGVFKVVKDGKVYDEDCDFVTHNNNDFYCEKDKQQYLIMSDMSIGIAIKDNMAYSNGDNYAVSYEADYGDYYVSDYRSNVEFYKDGKKVKNVECREITNNGKGAIKAGIYLLHTHYNAERCGIKQDQYEFYNEEGQKMFNKSFERAEQFDNNSLAVVSDDAINYYLIDKDGNKISQDYSSIIYIGGYYKVERDGLEGMIDKNGKEFVKCEYPLISFLLNDMALLKQNDSKYEVYNIKKQKKLLETSNNWIDVSTNHYILIEENGKSRYYTYDGKLFYEM